MCFQLTIQLALAGFAEFVPLLLCCCDVMTRALVFQLTIQLALAGFAEFVLHLTRLNPDMMYLHQDSGFLSVAYFKFDIDEQSGEASG